MAVTKAEFFEILHTEGIADGRSCFRLWEAHKGGLDLLSSGDVVKIAQEFIKSRRAVLKTIKTRKAKSDLGIATQTVYGQSTSPDGRPYIPVTEQEP